MKTTLFNSGWSFALAPIGDTPSPKDYAPIDIPHDWLIWNTNDLYGSGCGCYKKVFNLSCVAEKVFILRFEGVYADCDVLLNGEKIFEWKYGYTTFDVELTNAKEGENLLEVLVYHRSPNTRWYSGAGIYRNVWLTESGKNRILPDGVCFGTEKTEKGFKVCIDTEVVGSGKAVVEHTILDASGEVFATSSQDLVLASDTGLSVQHFEVEDPALWDIENPYLYTLVTKLLCDGEVAYERSEKVGFKDVVLTADEGMFLNGRHIKIFGTCMHHDMGALGSAVNREAIRRQLEKCKEMGINSIRTSHNPPAVELMELCDEMGLLVFSEFSDIWEYKKTEYDYARFFKEWHERDVASWVRRDRNHVSIFMWSIGNEIYDTHASCRGLALTKHLKQLVKNHDYYNLRPVSVSSNYMTWVPAQRCNDAADTVGYNYTERLYDNHHKEHPNWIIYGSETASTIQSRGIYHFPASKAITTHDDLQCSSLMNCAVSWGAKNVEYNINEDRKRKFSLGQYIWTAWDYIGEPTPYTTKNSYFGHIDTAGFEKDSFFAYRAEWLGEKAEPFVHIFPCWDFNEGQLIDLFIYSNCSETELLVNGVSQGRFKHNHVDGSELTGRWQVPYKKGCITAIGYDENGVEICRQERCTPEDPAKLCIKVNKTEMLANGEDMIFAEITAIDSNGNEVPNAKCEVEVEVLGAGRLVGLDNGDSTDYTQYKTTVKRLFSGKLLAMIASKTENGEVLVKASAKGLETAEVKLLATKAEVTKGICCDSECVKASLSGVVPVRKLEISVPTQTITPEIGEIIARVEILPKNSTFTLADVSYKAVNESGMVMDAVEIIPCDEGIKIIPRGAASYRLRAYCKNGTDHEDVISEIEMENVGFEPFSFNPYKEYSASLFTRATSELQNATAGGVHTAKSDITYANADFGVRGSDTVTLGLYALTYEPVEFTIVGNNDEVLAECYDIREPIWGTYQDVTFKLKRKVVGICDLTFKFKTQTRFRGFRFHEHSGVGTFIKATENQGLYGDAFEISGETIAKIGNNVSIEYGEFKFGEGISKIKITGRTRNQKDTVHLRFNANGEQDNRVVEFLGSDDFVTQEFALDNLKGDAKFTMVFMPGCDFDLRGFEFE